MPTIQRKVDLPEDIISDGLSSIASKSPTDLVQLNATEGLGPADALAVLTDFGSQVQQIKYEEAEKIRIAQETAERTQRTYQNMMAGTELIAAGSEELLRMRDSGGIIDGLYNLVKQGPKKFLRDELGITERQAKLKILTGQKMTAAATARAELEAQLDVQEAAIHKSLLDVGSRTVDVAGKVVTAQNQAEELRLKKAEGQRAAARLQFDLQKQRTEELKTAATNLLASASSTDLTDIVAQLEAAGATEMEYTDPIQGGVKVRIPVGFLRQQVKLKENQEALMSASTALAGTQQMEAAANLDKLILAQMPTKTLRQIVVSDGAFSIKDPKTGESITRVFDPVLVSKIAEERAGRVDFNDALLTSASAEEYAAQINALGPDATNEEIAGIPVPQEISSILGSFDMIDSSVDRIVSTANNLFAGPNGEIENIAVRGMVHDLTTDATESMELRSRIITGRTVVTPEVRKQIEDGQNKFVEKFLAKSQEIAKIYAGENKQLANFVNSAIIGSKATPEVAASAFMSLAIQPEAGVNAEASLSTREAMTQYNTARANIYAAALAKKGTPTGEVASKGVDSTMRALDALARANKREPVLSKEERRTLDIQALDLAAQQNRNTTRDSLLTGDISFFDPKTQSSLAGHEFLKIKGLTTFSERAEQRAQAQLAAERQDRKSKNTEDRKNANARHQELYYTEYAKLLLDAPAEGFDSGLQAYEDFIKQPAFSQGLQRMASGGNTGAIPDRVASQLFGPRTANGLVSDLSTVINVGRAVESTALETETRVRQSYRNDGFARLNAILEIMPNEVIGEQDATILASAVKQRVLTTNADARNPAAKTNNSIENIILHQKFEDARVEAIRKRVAKEWTTVAPIADRAFFVKEQTPKRR